MADENNGMPAPRETYQGPGKFEDGVNGFVSWATPGIIISTLGDIKWYKSLAEMVKNGKFVSSEFLAKGEKSKNFGTGAAVIALGMGVVGAVFNWNRAKTAEQQFNDMQDQRDAAVANAKIAGLENEAIKSHVGQMTHAFNEERRKFTDTIHSRHSNPEHAGTEHTAHSQPVGELAQTEHAMHEAAKEHHGEHTGEHAAHEGAKEHTGEHKEAGEQAPHAEHKEHVAGVQAAEHKTHTEHQPANDTQPRAAQFEQLASKDGHAAVAKARAEQVASAVPQVA